MEKPKVSLAILNYNGKKYLKTCLDSVREQSYENIEVVVTDNGSTDGSQGFIGQNYPEVKLVNNPVNVPIVGYNTGIRNSVGEFVAVLNNDTRLDKDWVKEMVELFESKPFVGMCTGKILYLEAPDTLNIGGVTIAKDGSCIVIGENKKDDGTFDESKEMFSTCNAGSMYRKKMLDEIGLFDEDFWLYYEEIDLSWRAYRAGWKSWYHPKAVMYHERGGTEGRFPLGRMYKGERNRVWTNIKNMPLSMLIPSFFYSFKRVFSQRGEKTGYVKQEVSLFTIGFTLIKAWGVGIFGSGKMIKKRLQMKGKLKKKDVKKFINP